MIDPIQNRLQLLNINSSEKLQNKNLRFKALLRDNINKANNLQKQANQLTEDFALGRTDNIHKVMIATEKAETAMQLTLAIQNKVIDAYKEMMRIQV